MSKIIQFKKLSPEDKLIESLNGEQTKLFSEVLTKIGADFQKLEIAFVEKCVECETLKLEIDLLKEKK